jgi:predicted DNA binding CopG/RHH family protein
MARKSIPDFKTEAEELAFWETHRIEDYDDGPADEIIWDIKPEKKKRITLRIEPSVIEDLKVLAEELDTPYQTLARGLIKRGVRQLQDAE